MDSRSNMRKCTCQTDDINHYICPLVRNPHLSTMEEDVLYHIGLSSSQNLREMFGDVRFVCVGGTPRRMESFAKFMITEINYKLPSGAVLEDISGYADRYSMYKVGPVLCVSHGMGCPSMSILLHELIKLTCHARCKDPIFIRIGTCGGVGVDGGSIVITEEALDAQLRGAYECIILGKSVLRPTKLDKVLVQELKAVASSSTSFNTVVGKTVCAHDFYEGQGRLDGAFCDYTEADKMKWLSQLHDQGVVNIEMESSVFAALTNEAGIRAAVVCVVVINRLKGDQVDIPKETMYEWQERPQKIVSALIRQYLGIRN